MTDRRRRQAAVAGHTGDEAAARRLLADESAAVRATALGALVRMERMTADDVRRALADADPSVRRRAATLAVPIADVDLVGLLDDADATVVEAAAWALGERGSNAAVDALTGVAEAHDDALCRESAVAALGAIGDERGLDAILAALRDQPAVRRRAVIALASFEGERVEAALRTALEDRDWQVRQAAEELLRD